VTTPHVDVAGRRAFLRRVVAGGAVVAIGPALVPAARFVPAGGAQAGTGVQLAAFAESVELVAVTAYEAGVELLSEDLAPVLQTFRGHHKEHADVYATRAGDAATGQANPALLEALTPAIEDFGSQNDVLRFARDLENQLSVSWGHLLTVLQERELATATATILPVESSHAATLSYELEEGAQAWFPFGALESADLAFGLDPDVFSVTPS
jgi:hypothetical protein